MLNHLFPGVLILTALLSAATAVFLLKVNRNNLAEKEKMPRMQLPGAVLGLIDLLWCIPNAKPILPENLHSYLLPLAIFLAVMAFLYLDHLLSRAIGGFMILSAHYFLKEGYAAQFPLESVFALFCLIFGTIGIFISGYPYLSREIIRQSCKGTVRGMAMPVFLLVFAAVLIFAAAATVAQGGRA